MNSGYYAACAGLQAQSQALEMTANNLANLNTTGYRAQTSLFRALLADAVAGSADPVNRAVNNFNLLGGSQTELRAGNLERTANPFDVAVEGDGFFVVQTPAGTLYTRDGNFQVSRTGRLTTSSGDPVLGEDGPILIPAGTISISPDGTLSSDGAVAGKLRVIEFAAGANLVPYGKSYYSVPAAQVHLAVDSYVRQGMLESSNVNPVESLVDLIAIQRRAEMLQRAMSGFSSNFDHVAASDLPRI